MFGLLTRCIGGDRWPAWGCSDRIKSLLRGRRSLEVSLVYPFPFRRRFAVALFAVFPASPAAPTATLIPQPKSNPGRTLFFLIHSHGANRRMSFMRGQEPINKTHLTLRSAPWLPGGRKLRRTRRSASPQSKRRIPERAPGDPPGKRRRRLRMLRRASGPGWMRLESGGSEFGFRPQKSTGHQSPYDARGCPKGSPQ